MLEAERDSRPKILIAEKALKYSYQDKFFYLDDRFAIIYALSLGLSQDPTDKKELKYTYEGRKDFTVFPTFSSMMTKSISLVGVFENKQFPIPQNPISLMAEYYTTWHLPKLVPNKEYRTKRSCMDIIDKSKFVLATFRMDTYQKESNNHHFTTFIRTALPGVKGDGFKGTGSWPLLPKKLSREQDRTISFKILPNQPLLYRLNGYTNSIHADPDVAKKLKFQRPIMHGLGTVQICIKQIVMQVFGGQDEVLKTAHARIFDLVYPGEELSLKLWQQGDIIIFEANVVNRKAYACFGMVQRRTQGKL